MFYNDTATTEIYTLSLHDALPISAVARDDLKDGGAAVWAATIRAIRYVNPETAIEVLTADFRGVSEHVDIVLEIGRAHV